ncbi:ABC transporter permease [Syntrophobacter fumaroxidans]|uniref:Binding-protein-dependent transport systems inner membrane component n=1 Tax=Syntrophobacter fumaroxidans (strain DSM 10017 / MPOB) TaxID=335543 RepID=A0LE79_SYNFM|nr:ABC transporter permease [Syntrophobacter fumaroxidans]ABK15731.1 binding-protein-dependent transport systems inner membrane component [Syntrophobacter fumaroxidans MPOB]
MNVISEGIVEAARLLVTLDPDVVAITLRTLQVSTTATFISVLIGLPFGTFLALTRFFGRGFVVSLVNFGMGLPPVVVGLVTWLFLTRYGPLGTLGLLYSPTAMVIAQAVIASPIVAGFAMAAIQSVNPKLRLQILSLGATRIQFLFLLLWEARLGILAAVIAGFGGVISEVGASMMVGGNVRGYTRVLTTATVLEVSKGSFALATGLSIILLALSFGIMASLSYLQQRGR